MVAGNIRTATPTCTAFVFMFKQTLHTKTTRFVSISDKYLTTYGLDEQRNARRSSCEMPTFVFNNKFHDNPFCGIRVLLFTHLPHFHHHNSLSFLKVILKTRRLLLETPFSCLANG
jgi:hypothetical protein